jgi:heme oxygenase
MYVLRVIENYHGSNASPEIDLSATPLPERLRLETRALHAESERSGVMVELLHGRLGRGAYAALLRNLHAIYAALEAALVANRRDVVIGPLHQPRLYRETALAQDLELLEGTDWRERLPVEPAAAQYVERLRALGAAGSRALVAHAYVRYLGDLHGGQVLRRLVAQQLALPQGRGTRFYEFGDEDQVLALRQGFRQTMAALRPSEEESDLIVAEACWAFRQHISLFEELSPRTS